MKSILKSLGILFLLAGIGFATNPDFEEFGGMGITIQVNPQGILVVDVIKNTPAESQGILKGDVIVEVNGESVAGIKIEPAKNLLRGTPGTQLNLMINRQNTGDLNFSLTRSSFYLRNYTVKGLDSKKIEEIKSVQPSSSMQLIDILTNGQSIVLTNPNQDQNYAITTVYTRKTTVESEGATLKPKVTIPKTPENYFSIEKDALKYSTDIASNNVLELYSAEGNLVTTLFSGFQSAGEQSLEFKISSLNQGQYFIVLKTNNQSLSQPLTINH
jgi:membrane-associated protease RseP (regulator of RpoE activity)